jgi:OOP family OmpA-OmpF porin
MLLRGFLSVALTMGALAMAALVVTVPSRAEGRDSPPSSDGCPDRQITPGVPQRCPEHAITLDEAAKRAGGRPDRDHDGIPDADDKCPDQPENENGFDDEDGCPDIADCVVRRGPLVLDYRILFKRNSALIPRVSQPILDTVVGTLVKYPTSFEVAGHRVVSEQRSVSLSRAQHVIDYLVKHGVDPSRLTAKDYGSSCAHVGAKDPALNRRVDFKRVAP